MLKRSAYRYRVLKQIHLVTVIFEKKRKSDAACLPHSLVLSVNKRNIYLVSKRWIKKNLKDRIGNSRPEYISPSIAYVQNVKIFSSNRLLHILKFNDTKNKSMIFEAALKNRNRSVKGRGHKITGLVGVITGT